MSRLKELADVFAISVAGFSILDNHLHVLVRLDLDLAQGWSDEEVARRWGQLYPPRNRRREKLPVLPEQSPHTSVGATAESWQEQLMQLKKKFTCRKITGRFLATTREVLTKAAQRLGMHHLVNLAGRDHLQSLPAPSPSR